MATTILKSYDDLMVTYKALDALYMAANYQSAARRDGADTEAAYKGCGPIIERTRRDIELNWLGFSNAPAYDLELAPRTLKRALATARDAGWIRHNDRATLPAQITDLIARLA